MTETDNFMSTERGGWAVSSILLAVIGIILIGVGAYFILIRATFLPEDLRFLGMSQGQIEASIPRLKTWLDHVFRVLGGFIAATGILVTTLAASRKTVGSVVAVAAAGVVSIGLMTAVNFSIESDFRWELLAIAVLWACGTVWYGIDASRMSERRNSEKFPVELHGYERQYSDSVRLDASVEDVFAFADDFTQLSSHMGESSMMMMGSTMQTVLDEGRGQRVGSHIRMSGKTLGLELFLDEVVLQREPPRYKLWETVGTPRLLVIGGYRMGFDVASLPQGAALRVFIGYNLPSSPGLRLFGRVLGPVYAKWCVRQMLDGAAARFAARK
jgi:hypothetical protein